MIRFFFLTLLTASSALAQMNAANPGFEMGEVGKDPKGWSVHKRGGFGTVLVDQGCRTRLSCAMMTDSENPVENTFGNLMQSISAGGYNLRRIRSTPFDS